MTTAMTTNNSGASSTTSLEHLITFFGDYSSALLSSGCTTLRIEKNVRRMAAHYGVDIVMTVMPKHVELMLTDGARSLTRIADWHRGINFSIITSLSHLSWKVVDDNLPLPAARRCLGVITARPRMNIAMVTLMAAMANACFCRLFEGDYWAMLFVFLGTAGGFIVKHRLAGLGLDVRVATVVAAILSAIIACGAHIYGLGNTPEVAVATSVLYLVPGIAYINAFSDFINGHYVCSMSWLFSALETTVCLGSGLVLADFILNL